ncbi:MAG: hypothetical protein KUA43_13880 [Hoeflea sp.]|uniref:hypothetical protein n=1 Tax=Hoeflea sp. TaxID=1940281 RepID=UPI001DB49C6C|nr:hypothetical protein [Hoeflea sp.]MBU4531248.1 hypothetical protein [Alphaproteobacteria bacterium]MBU4545689.1 hypothetical protein [Alphaproteobacteria bacterium]MBU4550658.1 hypothetical protein [Alphaproteobacteria bacterium]MBV1724525.1 hypothetical protein [Hoeflea sp.]MBV1760545.1 hypothetical protein [Hoeflea sp.]
MKPFPKMADQFPDFDQTTLPPIPPHWTDSSWRNDACPSFTIGDVDGGWFLHVFIDHSDPAKREFSEGGRFTVCYPDDDPRESLSREFWHDVLLAAALWEQEQTRAVASSVDDCGFDTEDFSAWIHQRIDDGGGLVTFPDGSGALITPTAFVVWVVTGENGPLGRFVDVQHPDEAGYLLRDARFARQAVDVPDPDPRNMFEQIVAMVLQSPSNRESRT